jgi:predicted O-methyltransferase YrrM
VPEIVVILTLHKARRTLNNWGPGALIGRAKSEVFGAASAYWCLRKKPTFRSPDSLIDFGTTAFHGLLRPYQVRWEILSLLELVRRLRPLMVLEIGTARGGTLLFWTRTIPEDAHLISIDLPAGDFGDGYVSWRAPIYRSLAIGMQHIDLLRGDSHSQRTLEETKALLGGRKVDFLFIDAGHTYSDVKQDFEMYSPLVAPGGLIAFHDIAVHPASAGCEVHRFWSEIKSRFESGEFIENPEQGWAGIGYLWWQPLGAELVEQSVQASQAHAAEAESSQAGLV